jgi:hypothetical protein
MAVAFGTLIFACDVQDEEAGLPKRPSTLDATVATDAPLASDGQTKVLGLCSKIGGAAQVAAISNAIFDKVAADCRIGIYFTSLGGRASHVKDCMAIQLEETFDCEGVTFAKSKAPSDGKECRSLTQAHQDVTGADGKQGLNDQDFLAYMLNVSAALQEAKLSDSEITSVTGALNNLRTAVAPRTSPFNSYCTCAGNAFEGKACAPDGGYILPDAGIADTGVADTNVADTNVADTALPPDAADAASE